MLYLSYIDKKKIPIEIIIRAGIPKKMITFVLFNKRQSQIKSQIDSALHRKNSLPPHT